MSSTYRTKAEKAASVDYYCTPLQPIRDFIKCATLDGHMSTPEETGSILDPCAGGVRASLETPMSYPMALAEFGYKNIQTVDIRQDSLAAIKGDYLKIECAVRYDLIITNPPFKLALPIILKALDEIKPSGRVVMLQRLNFMGSQERHRFFADNPPVAVYVHSKRMAFSAASGTDSIEYAHFVWQKKNDKGFSELRVI